MRISLHTARIVTATVVLTSAGRHADAKVHVREITLTTTASTCAHDMDEKKFDLKKNKDIVIWDISNNCGKEQQVTLCTSRSDAFVKPCQSAPTSGRDLNTPFPVKAGETIRLTCDGDQYGPVTVRLESGDSPIPCTTAMTAKSAPIVPPYHVIEIEIVP